MEEILLTYYTILVGAVVMASITTSDSRSLTDEQVIARCKDLAQTKASELVIPTRAGAVDSTGWNSSHPCRFSYFERDCRAKVEKEVFDYCFNQTKGR